MFPDQLKVKRQTEIAAICANRNGKITIADLSFDYNVEELTIKRDLQDLRSIGINIHSTRTGGVIIEGNIPEELLQKLLMQYTSINHTNTYINRSAGLLVTMSGSKALYNITLLQKCIDRNLAAIIEYRKTVSGIEEREIYPLLIFESDGGWRILSQSGSSTKQFRFDRIVNVRALKKNFSPISRSSIDALFDNSWKCWIGNEEYNVKLLLKDNQKEWTETKMMIKNQKITSLENGEILFEVKVNSLSEITSWVVSRGKGCIVLEPEELKQRVIELARETLGNYQGEGVTISHDGNRVTDQQILER